MKLPNSILKQLDQFDYSTNRGLLDTNETPLYVVKNNKVDAILIEAGFISDDSDLYYLKNYTKNIATAIAAGIKKKSELIRLLLCELSIVQPSINSILI